MERRPYPTDLTDEQWEILATVLPPAKPGGRPRAVDLREVVNALLYQNRTGCQWDMLPHDFPPKSTVYEYFSAWRDDGTWERIGDVLRRGVRALEARSGEPTPSAASIDSQTVKTGGQEANGATTVARKSTVASGIWRSIRSDCSWRLSSRVRRWMMPSLPPPFSVSSTAKALPGCRWSGRTASTTIMSSMPGWRPARGRIRGGWRLSGDRRINKVSCDCRSAGLSNAAWPGWGAHAD